MGDHDSCAGTRLALATARRTRISKLTTTGPDLDVVIHVLSGSGQLATEFGSLDLEFGTLVSLPRCSRRQFGAEPGGLCYLLCTSAAKRWCCKHWKQHRAPIFGRSS